MLILTLPLFFILLFNNPFYNNFMKELMKFFSMINTFGFLLLFLSYNFEKEKINGLIIIYLFLVLSLFFYLVTYNKSKLYILNNKTLSTNSYKKI